MTQLQIVSDLHLEFRNSFNKLLIPSAPILCLLGDICACGNDKDFNIYKEFIKYISPKFKHIIHIPGNHEYYTCGNKNITINDTIPHIDKKIRVFIKPFKNVHYLNNNTLHLIINNKNYVFIGTTLWTGVNPEYRIALQKRMNDYTHLYMPTAKATISNNLIRKYTIEDMSALHIKSVKYIKSEVKKLKTTDIGIILTHHKPYINKIQKDIIYQAYETNILGEVIKMTPNIKLWGYGHTHVKDDIIKDGVRVISNPKGYPDQHTKYNSKFSINV